MQPVALAVVHGDPERINLGRAIRTARVERRRLALRHLAHQAKHFAARRLIKTRLGGAFANRLEQPHGCHPRHIPGVFRDVEAHAHVALRAEMVDLVRLNRVHRLVRRDRVGEVAVVEKEVVVGKMRILVNAVEAFRVKRRCAPDHAVHLVALGEEQFGEIRAVLSGDSGDKRLLWHAARDSENRGWVKRYFPAATARRARGPLIPQAPLGFCAILRA